MKGVPLWGLLGCSWGSSWLLGPLSPWGPLGLWAHLGPSWDALGGVLEGLLKVYGISWCALGGPPGPPWALGPSQGDLWGVLGSLLKDICKSLILSPIENYMLHGVSCGNKNGVSWPPLGPPALGHWALGPWGPSGSPGSLPGVSLGYLGDLGHSFSSIGPGLDVGLSFVHGLPSYTCSPDVLHFS